MDDLGGDLGFTFLTRMTMKDGRLSPLTKHLADNLHQLDGDIVRIWAILHTNGHPGKALDFQRLLNNIGAKTIADIKDIKKNIRLEKAKEFANEGKLILEQYLKQSLGQHRKNIFESIKQIFNKGTPEDIDNFIALYANDPFVRDKLLELKGKSPTNISEGLSKLFDGQEFNAHHILPVNLIYNNNFTLGA